MQKEKKKKKKLRFKAILAIILLVYLLISIVYYLINKPVKEIIINGNNYLKDNYIIDYLNIENQNIFKINKKKIKNKLLELELINEVEVKKNYLGKLIINIKEDNVLFYNLLNKTLVLSSGKEIKENNFSDAYLGVPILTNMVPNDIYKELINKLIRVNKNVLESVSEIAYDPSKVGEKIVDDKRFKLLMNDGNTVYINTVNIEKFNDYLEIYEGIVSKNGNIKGCLYLDSSSENNHFNDCSGSGDNG